MRSVVIACAPGNWGIGVPGWWIQFMCWAALHAMLLGFWSKEGKVKALLSGIWQAGSDSDTVKLGLR